MANKVIIATEKQMIAVAAAGAKAANNAAMGTLKGILQDASTHYETMSNTVDNIGEKLDDVEQALDYQGTAIPLTGSGAKALNAALKDYLKVQKASATALAKAEKAILKAVAAIDKGKVAPAAAAEKEDDSEDEDESADE